jgi:VanZ family protein
MNNVLKYYGPATLWALFIFIMCSVKFGAVSNSPMFFPGFDKLVHCGFFFVLVIFSFYGLAQQQFLPVIPYKPVLLIVALSVLYGGIIELLQLYIFTWRSGEWDDLFADAVGASMGGFGILLTVYGIRYAKK